LAFAIFVVCFGIDLATPQTLVVAILLDVPIVVIAFAGNRRLTTTMVVLALLADVAAGYFNGIQQGGRWEPIGLGDRLLAALSIVLVGNLSIAVAERGRRAGQAEANEHRARREARLGAAVDRIRSSLSFELVVRAIVREAPAVFDATAARWLPADDSGERLATTPTGDVVPRQDALEPEAASVVRRVLDRGDVEAFGEDDAFGRLVVNLVAARAALVIPLVDGSRAFGVLLVAFDEPSPDEATLGLARTFGRAGSAALAQAALFDELAARNERLTERGAVIRDLVYALSHDLRTPLAALGMTLAQAREGAYGELPPRYRAVLDSSIVATDDLQDLAETLLRVARFESGEPSAARAPVDLAELVAEIVAELEALGRSRGVTLRAAATTHAVTSGDRGDLRRAVRNLVANALANTPSGGHVAVDLEEDGTMVRLTVRDDGYGVPSGIRSNLFQRFSNVAQAGGTGLGLYLVRRVAEDVGGSVDYSEGEPRGSVFTLRLPRAPA
jgi:signal transduction histidine kinase